MQFEIKAPSYVKASVQLPSSKSISNRILIIQALTDSKFPIKNLSDCDDTQVMLKALTGEEETIDIQAAGTAMRFLTAYFSITEGCRILTGTKRMQQRPISVLAEALKELGAEIKYTAQEGFPPLKICGSKLTGKEITLQGNVSSQYISALLMIAPVLENGLILHIKGEIVSRPYFDLTLQLMKEYGIEATWLTGTTLQILPQKYQASPFTVESDWSAAAYWYEITALANAAEIELSGLFPKSYQGDSKAIEIFALLGVETCFDKGKVKLKKIPAKVKYLEYNFIDQPDLVQTFVVTCALLGIPFRFTGIQSLKIKETDRIQALITEMNKLGYALYEEKGSALYWEGKHTTEKETPVIHTYQDHRMAMAFAPACLRIPYLYINHPQVVSKSYPFYWEHLRQAGFYLTKV